MSFLRSTLSINRHSELVSTRRSSFTSYLKGFSNDVEALHFKVVALCALFCLLMFGPCKMKLINSLIKVPTDIILVCMNPHGTRAVQKLLENLNDPIQVKLVMRALYRGAATLANDLNGHHVIQYCLVHFHSDINKPILNEIANECYKIATDRSGCCVLQASVEHSCGEVRTRIVSEIMANSLHLAEDPFGNYVLQHMVGLNIPEFTALLVRQLQGNFAVTFLWTKQDNSNSSIPA